MKSKTALIKFIVLQIFLFAETIIFSILVSEYVQKQDFFHIDWIFSLQIVGLMVLSLYTISLIIIIENISQNSIITSLVFALGISIPVFYYSLTYAAIIGLLALFIMFLDNYRVERIKKIMIKPRPSNLLRKSSKGLLFMLSIFAGLLVALEISGIEKINVGEKVGEILEEPLETFIQQKVEEQIDNREAQVSPLLEDFGLPSIKLDPKMITSGLDFNIKDIVANQVNTFIEPYKKFISPLMAVLTFGLFQLFAGAAYLIFILTVNIIFAIALKTGLIKKEIIQVEKEKLIF